MTWYVLENSEERGPYTLEEILSKKQQGFLFDHSYLWAEHLKAWTPMGRLEEFRSQIFSSDGQTLNESLNSILNKRSSPRIQHIKTCFIQNQTSTVLKGVSHSLSLGGAGFLLRNSTLKINECVRIFIHHENPSLRLSCDAVVLSKSHFIHPTIADKFALDVRDLTQHSPFYYCVRFLESSEEFQNQLKEIIYGHS